MPQTESTNLPILHISILKESKFDRVVYNVQDNKQFLIASEKKVSWYYCDKVIRTLQFNDPVIVAHFVQFENDPNSCLAVFFNDCAHIYYKEGGSYIVNFPFHLRNAYPFEYGVVLQRDTSIDFGRNNILLTMSDPFEEFGNIVSAATGSIPPEEAVIYFPLKANDTLCVTLNMETKTIFFYDVRLLSKSYRSNKASKKLSIDMNNLRKSSIMNVRSSITNSSSDVLSSEKRRTTSNYSVSNEGIQPMDRVQTNADEDLMMKFDSILLTKSAMLSKIDSTQVEVDEANDIKVIQLNADTKEAIVLYNSFTSTCKVVVFNTGGKDFGSKTTMANSFDLSGYYNDILKMDGYPGFLLLLSTDGAFFMYNPFLELYTSYQFKTDFAINALLSSAHGDILVSSEEGVVKLHLSTEPNDSLTKRSMQMLSYLTNSFGYSYLKLLWLNMFSRTGDEWHAFQISIFSVLLPPSATKIPTELMDDVRYLQKTASFIPEYNLLQIIPNFALSLHLLREELKLNISEHSNQIKLEKFLAHLTYMLGWSEQWYQEYGKYDVEKYSKMTLNQILTVPPDLFKSLSSLFEGNIVPYYTFSQIAEEDESVDELVTQRTFQVLRIFEAIISNEYSPTDILQMISEFNISNMDLESFPLGIYVPIKELVAQCKNDMVSITQGIDLDILGRKDLSRTLEPNDYSQHTETRRDKINNSQSLIRDIYDRNEDLSKETERGGLLVNVMKKIFSRDKRVFEVSKLLQTHMPQIMFDDSSVYRDETGFLLRRRKLTKFAATRALALAVGIGALFYGFKVPLVTEEYPIQKINFSAIIYPDKALFNFDPSDLNEGDLDWGYFHNGFAGGIKIAKNTTGINGSWIVFNKPRHLTAQHGGFLMALGLNGHLKNLEEWHIYNYLGPKQNHISIGLLLGMSASMRASMDLKVTKLLSVHVNALLPTGSADLNVSIPVQTAGAVGVGLLYQGSQHRRMSEIFLKELTTCIYTVEEKRIIDEAYRLACGIAVGLINLGKGEDLFHMADNSLVSNLVDLCFSFHDMQGETLFDKTHAGATIALMLMFLKTNNINIAQKVKPPSIAQKMDYFRPDILLLRELASNMITWDLIEDNYDWVLSKIPGSSVDFMRTLDMDSLPLLYVLTGSLLSIGVRYASSFNQNARDLVIAFLDELLIVREKPLTNFSMVHILRGVNECINNLCIAASLIMSGSGDIAVFRRLRIVYGDIPMDDRGLDRMGQYTAVGMAMGFLFLGSGQYAFDTTNLESVATLLISIYPNYCSMRQKDESVYLPALRNFWSMSLEPRCIIVRDTITSQTLEIDVHVTMKSGDIIELHAPCLIPSFSEIESITTSDDSYYTVSIRTDSPEIAEFKKHLTIFVSKRPSRLQIKNEAIDELDVKSELEMMIKDPTLDHLWQLKMIFRFYENINISTKHYLDQEYIDRLKLQLWELMMTDV